MICPECNNTGMVILASGTREDGSQFGLIDRCEACNQDDE